MYKVVIIDDEAMIREGIRTIIDWDYYGFEIIAEAEDGYIGEEVISEYHPDLVLVDIRMPGQSGIELLKSIREKGYIGKAIILTGYAEFEYAKEAIRLEVEAYLLKPIEEDELCQMLEKAKSELDKEAETTRYIENSQAMRRVSLCQKLVFETLNDQERWMIQEDDFFGSQENYHIVLVSKEDGLHQKVEKLVKEFSQNKNSAVYIPLREYYLFVIRNKTFRQLEVILNDLLIKHQRLTGIECFVSVGSQVKGYMKLKRSFEDSKGLFDRRFLFRNQPIIFWDAYVNDTEEDTNIIIDVEYIYGLIEIGNQGAMEVYFSKLEESLINSSLNVDKIKGTCVTGFIEIKEKLSYHYNRSINFIPDNKVVVDQIYEFNHLSDIITYMLQIFTIISELICDGSYENTIKRLLNYIHTNYDKNLKLEGLSRLFGYNSSYLGKLFKETMGKSFNQYLDEIRIEHAKELLETNEYKVHQIATKVGYNNVDYFYSKFKKFVGISPNAYKKQN